MGGIGQQRVGGRSGFLILALLALWVQVLVPAGFMLTTTGSSPSPGLVVCTGHGALDLGDHSHSGKAPRSKADAPCVFAGHGLATAATEPLRISGPAYLFGAPAARTPVAPSPATGLAAPPPPSRGPPLA